MDKKLDDIKISVSSPIMINPENNFGDEEINKIVSSLLSQKMINMKFSCPLISSGSFGTHKFNYVIKDIIIIELYSDYALFTNKQDNKQYIIPYPYIEDICFKISFLEYPFVPKNIYSLFSAMKDFRPVKITTLEGKIDSGFVAKMDNLIFLLSPVFMGYEEMSKRKDNIKNTNLKVFFYDDIEKVEDGEINTMVGD